MADNSEKPIPYGPNNPHPLSRMTTELVWDGKYDEFGNRREVDIADWQPGKPFNHHWQDYRTRKDRTLKTVSEAGHEYPKKGTYTACVKVVDTFGCDTSITVEVRV